MESNLIGLFANIEIFIFVGYYAWCLHKVKTDTAALEDKIIITTLMYAFIGMTRYAAVIIGYSMSDERVSFLSLAQNVCVMIIGTCIGLSYNQQVKDLNKLNGKINRTSKATKESEDKPQGSTL